MCISLGDTPRDAAAGSRGRGMLGVGDTAMKASEGIIPVYISPKTVSPPSPCPGSSSVGSVCISLRTDAVELFPCLLASWTSSFVKCVFCPLKKHTHTKRNYLFPVVL